MKNVSRYCAPPLGRGYDFLHGVVGGQAYHPAPDSYWGNCYLTFGITNQLDVGNSFTYSFWAKVDGSGHMYLAYGVPEGGYQQSIICGYTVPNCFEFFSADAIVGGGMNPRTGSQLPIPDKEWHHYAYTYDSTNWRGYRDGSLIANSVRTFSLSPLKSPYVIGRSSAQDFFWGRN